MSDLRTAGKRRETRLLLATIAVSVGMLLLLARFRFPEEASGRTAEPAPAPLERLAARATYDELASVMADLERRILPAIVPLAAQGEDGIRYLPAVRVTPDRAVAVLARDRRLVSMGPESPPPIVLRDTATELVVVQVPSQPDVVPTVPAAVARTGPRYLALAEASGTAAALRPVYVGRTDPSSDRRWSDPVLSVAAVQQSVSNGSAVFALDGTFLGLATEAAGKVVIVPAGALRNAAAGTLAAPAGRSDLPVEVQPLTQALARATGTDRGVMVSRVLAAAAGALAPGDVIQSIDGVEIATVAGFQQIAQSRSPGTQVDVHAIRRGERITVTLTATKEGSSESHPDQDLGATLRAVADVGSELVTVEPGGAAERAGLRSRDLIVGVDGETGPAPGALLRKFRAAKSGQALLLTVRRDGDQRVVALEKR